MKRKRVLACACVLLAGIVLYSGQTVFASFYDNDNGTVSDSVTTLMWQQGDGQNSSDRTWEDALDYCENLSLGGHSDWRLPNVRELESIVDWDRYNPAINTIYFPGCRSSYYWSGSIDAVNSGLAWHVDFYNGAVTGYNYEVYDYYVRCVRGGPSGSVDYSIISTAGTGGTISPSGTVKVTSGANQTFTITANSGYQISDVKVDGVSQGVISTYTFTNVSENHTISASFSQEIATHTITTTAGTGGSITPSGSVTVNDGANQTFTITANSGYQISDVKVDGVSQGVISTYTFTNVSENHTISASFSQEIATHTITTTAGTGGSITPSGSVTVNDGANQTFTITANNGYQISDVKVDGVSQGVISTYTFTNVSENHTISASFSQEIATHTITTTAGTGGSITPSGSVTVNDGANQTFTITANNGYQISDVKVDGVSQGVISTYTFTNVSENHTISASFSQEIATHTITTTAGTGGSITPSGSVTVNDGANQTFTITANNGYQISDVKVDGVSQGVISTYTFTNVSENHTISASFSQEIATHTITTTAGTGGSITPSGSVTVNDGASQTFIITANSGYQISEVLVDGVSQGTVGTYTFTNVTGEHAIFVSFAVAPPTAEVTGKITNTDTGEGISEATVSFDQGEYVLTTASDGTFSSSVIPAGTYEVEISATNYYTKALSNVTLSAGMTNDLSSALTPKSPEIVSTGADPDEVYNDGATTTLLTAKVTHPDGSGDISSVVVDLAQIGGSASQEMYDDGTHGDAVSGDGTYSYQTTVATATPVQQFSLNVTASDLYGFKAYGNIDIKVIKKIIATAEPEQVDTHTITNSLSSQTLVISFKLDSSKTSKYGGFQREGECYVELTVYRPDGTVYGVYNVTESIDISIPKAEAGDWKFKTVNKCTTSVTYEIETKGSGTGMFVGRVTNAYTGLGIVGATVTCNTGGSTVTLYDGYFSGVAVAGTDAAVTSTSTGYHTKVHVNIAIMAGAATSLAIQMISDASAAQPVPSSPQWYTINEPKKDPDPLTQPFAAKELQGNLYFNALFPLYQEPVNIYLAVSFIYPGMTGKIFLFKENNDLVELTDTFYPWRTGVSASQSSQILSIPLSLLPTFSCIFYSVVTTDPVSFSNYDLVSFTLPINQATTNGDPVTARLFLKKMFSGSAPSD